MSQETDLEFVRMSENLLRSSRHYAERLADAVSRGLVSPLAAEKIRAHVAEIVSVSIQSSGTLARVPAYDEKK